MSSSVNPYALSIFLNSETKLFCHRFSKKKVFSMYIIYIEYIKKIFKIRRFVIDSPCFVIDSPRFVIDSTYFVIDSPHFVIDSPRFVIDFIFAYGGTLRIAQASGSMPSPARIAYRGSPIEDRPPDTSPDNYN